MSTEGFVVTWRCTNTSAPVPLSAQDVQADEQGEWSPCRHPERPFDDDLAFHDSCQACLLAAEAGEARGEKHLPIAALRDRLDTWGAAAP